YPELWRQSPPGQWRSRHRANSDRSAVAPAPSPFEAPRRLLPAWLASRATREPDDAADFIRDYGELRRRFGTVPSRPSSLTGINQSVLARYQSMVVARPLSSTVAALQPSVTSACEGSMA